MAHLPPADEQLGVADASIRYFFELPEVVLKVYPSLYVPCAQVMGQSHIFHINRKRPSSDFCSRTHLKNFCTVAHFFITLVAIK